ncbi:MAG: GDSL-type esterase/lipase family protein [Chthoniobacteraceae bacterium]
MILKRYLPYCASAFLAIFNLAGSCYAQDPTGPTPFPAKDSPLWQGKGVIRVFPWMVDNRNYFWTKRAEAQNAVVFVGDSLTGNWGDVAKMFQKMHVANRGIGGDVSRGVLFRFKEDVLDLHPKAIVILIGSNDLSAKEAPSDAISNITDILALAEKGAPSAPIILCTIPPRDSKEAPIDVSQLKELNDDITKLAQGKKNVTLLDLFPLFVLPDGSSPDPQYFRPDKLHFGPVGYAKWHDALEPIFTNLKLE